MKKLSFLFLAFFLSACGGDNIDIKCGDHKIKGIVKFDVAKVSVDNINIILPLQGVFTDEPTAKYAPKYLSSPEFAMTVKDYVGITFDNKKVDLMAYSRKDKIEYYEFEIDGKKWQCQ